jgi:hypothetical protein
MKTIGSWEIRPSTVVLMRRIAGEYGDRYVGEVLLPSLARAARADAASIKDVRDALSDPYRCLEAVYAHYAFSRRGRDRNELAQIAVEALHQAVRPAAFEQFLNQPDASVLWDHYVEVSRRYRRKPMEQLNRGVIAGLAELAQEVYRCDGVGSIANWVFKGVLQTDRLESQFLRIVDIRGVGPKLGSLFVRDAAFIFGLEEQIDPIDRLYLQPVDKWLRLMAPYLGEDAEDSADWVLAGKLAKYTRRVGVSGVRFNMGVTYLGSKVARVAESFDDVISDLIEVD